jgi:hypothetical protein
MKNMKKNKNQSKKEVVLDETCGIKNSFASFFTGGKK